MVLVAGTLWMSRHSGRLWAGWASSGVPILLAVVAAVAAVEVGASVE